MNYIGSKLSLLPFLEQSILSVADTHCRSFCDLFAGTGVVGRHFKQKGFDIIANDLQHYSFVLNRHYIGNQQSLHFQGLKILIPEIEQEKQTAQQLVCRYLSKVTPVKGFIYQNYCAGGTQNLPEPRLYFTDENGMICDAIRRTIEAWHAQKLINEDEYYFLLASLIESIDKLANTASVYGAYLKK